MTDIKVYFDKFCKENNLDIILSYDMPQGYETAYGSFDVTQNTLYINNQLLAESDEYQSLFYLFHELRHAMQYSHPEQFDERIQKSSRYSILYNGICSKLIDNQWKTCKIDGSEEYFTNAYLNSLHEIDANTFAYNMVISVLGHSKQLETLYNWWMPKQRFEYNEFIRIYDQIDNNI